MKLFLLLVLLTIFSTASGSGSWVGSMNTAGSWHSSTGMGDMGSMGSMDDMGSMGSMDSGSMGSMGSMGGDCRMLDEIVAYTDCRNYEGAMEGTQESCFDTCLNEPTCLGIQTDN